MSKTQALTVRIKKGKDGRTALSCVRSDGTTTWQRQEGGQAAFFPRHDLTHYAVETTLRLGDGFFGLVAAGWDFSDFGTPWPRGRVPIGGNLIEIIVGFFDLERSSGERPSADEINQKVAECCAELGVSTQLSVSEADIDRVRLKRAELFAKWEATKPGDTLELHFEVGSERFNASFGRSIC